MPFQVGESQTVADIGKTHLQVFAYRPEGPISSFLLLFHGIKRNGAAYRDRAIPLAEQLRSLVVAPIFEQQRFPGPLY